MWTDFNDAGERYLAAHLAVLMMWKLTIGYRPTYIHSTADHLIGAAKRNLSRFDDVIWC